MPSTRTLPPPPLVRPQRLTSIETAARYADVNPRTIRRWIASGLLPAYRVGPRLIKLDLDDLDRIARRIPASDAARVK